MNKNSRIVLIVAAHSDDEALGCGGTIARHVKDGDSVYALFMTDGVGSRKSSGGREAIERKQSSQLAASILGLKDTDSEIFPDNAMDTVSLLEVVKAIEEKVDKWGMPDIVYTHYSNDLNIDHRRTFDAVMTCFRPQPHCRGKPQKILSFEVPSSTGWYDNQHHCFSPNYFVDISSTLETKKKALNAYSTEMKDWPHARSIQAVEYLARYRGSSLGVEAAEAFQLVRRIR
jgi:N-acetylglucosamine malate deacetylase 1